MTDSHKKIYVSIRAEQIKDFQDKTNGHVFVNPYPIETAIEIAERQLSQDLSNGALRVSLDDLLLESNEYCMSKFNNNTIELAKVTV